MNNSSCAKLSALAGRDIKRYIYNQLLYSKYTEIQKVKSGDMLNTISSDTANVCSFISGDLTGLFSQFAMAFAAIVYLLSVNPRLCIVTLAYTPIGMFFTLSLNRKMNAIITGLNGISYLAILAIGAVFVYYELSDWGTVIALTGLKQSTDCLFSECGQFMAGMQTNIAGVKRLLAVLSEPNETFSNDRKFIT